MKIEHCNTVSRTALVISVLRSAALTIRGSENRVKLAIAQKKVFIFFLRHGLSLKLDSWVVISPKLDLLKDFFCFGMDSLIGPQ